MKFLQLNLKGFFKKKIQLVQLPDQFNRLSWMKFLQLNLNGFLKKKIQLVQLPDQAVYK